MHASKNSLIIHAIGVTKAVISLVKIKVNDMTGPVRNNNDKDVHMYITGYSLS